MPIIDWKIWRVHASLHLRVGTEYPVGIRLEEQPRVRQPWSPSFWNFYCAVITALAANH